MCVCVTRRSTGRNSLVFFPLQSGELKEVNPKWLVLARSKFYRAAEGIKMAVDKTDLTDQEACRILNDRLMRVRSTLPVLTRFSVVEGGQSVESFIFFNTLNLSISGRN